MEIKTVKEIKTNKYNALQKANITDDSLIGTRPINPESFNVTDKKEEKKGCSGCSRSSRNHNGSRH